MTAEVASSGLGLFLGNKRSRPLPTLAIAALVTAIVAVPLFFLARDSAGTDRPIVVAPADAELVVVDMADGGAQPLDLMTIGGPILISVTEDDATSVAFSLFVAGGDDPIIQAIDTVGPRFDLIASESGDGEPLDSTMLTNGDYELFVTIRVDGEDRRTAVTFSVDNS